MRILVVDDHVESAFVARRLLSILGYEVDVAYSGPAAIEKAADFKPEIIFLDVSMPLMDGFETCAALRKMPETRDTIIIALTGMEKTQIHDRAREAGFNDIVVKATGVEALQEKIAAHTRQVPGHPGH